MPKAKDPHDLSPALSQPISAPSDVPQLGGDAALTHIVAALTDPDPAMRQKAVDALDRSGGGDAVTDLLLSGLGDSDGSVQQRAARALGRIGGERVLSALLVAMYSPTHLAARGEILMALGRIGSEQAYEALINFPDNWGSSPQHRDLKQAFKLMSQYHPDLLAARLVEMLPSDDIRVCSKLVQVAGLARPAGLAGPMMAFAADKSQSAQTRRTAIRVLRAIGGTKASSLLIDLLRDGEKDIIKWVADALGALKDPDTIPQLIALLEHPNWQVRAWTAEILGKRKASAAVPALTDLLSDERKEVRAKAVRALVRIHTYPALMAALAALRDPIAKVRDEVLEALRRQSFRVPPEIIPELLRLLADPAAIEHLSVSLILWNIGIHHPDVLLPYRDTLRPYADDADRQVAVAMSGLMSLLNRFP